MLNSFCKIQETTGDKRILIVTLVKILLKSKHAITHVLQTFRTNTGLKRPMLHRMNLYTSVLPFAIHLSLSRVLLVE